MRNIVLAGVALGALLAVVSVYAGCGGEDSGPACGYRYGVLKAASSIADCATQSCYSNGHCCGQESPIYCDGNCWTTASASCAGCPNAVASCH